MSKRQSVAAEDRRTTILLAAKEAFSRYGYQRTSMADVAQLAGVSRPALYEHFQNRSDLFLSLAESICETGLASARAAWTADLTPAKGLEAAILARDLELFRLRFSPHGAELFAHGAEATRAVHARVEEELALFVAKRLGRRGAEGKAVGLTIVRAMDGLKQGASTEEEYVASVRRLAGALAAGFASG
jgi:AcrR family transcriptional regulator